MEVGTLVKRKEEGKVGGRAVQVDKGSRKGGVTKQKVPRGVVLEYIEVRIKIPKRDTALAADTF